VGSDLGSLQVGGWKQEKRQKEGKKVKKHKHKKIYNEK
jgi:hypothetical protein